VEDAPLTMRFVKFKKKFMCGGGLVFPKAFLARMQGDLAISTEGMYTFEVYSSNAEVEFLMGHNHCKDNGEYGMTNCATREEIQKRRFFDKVLR